MIKNCKKCGEELSKIFGAILTLNHDKYINLFVCGNRCCEDFGVVKVISECPDHLDGHSFISCDDLPAPCSCGGQNYE